jgi:hypothetical protein
LSFPKFFFGKGKAMSSHVIRKDRRQPESVRIKSAKGGMNDDVLKGTTTGHFEQNASDHFEQGYRLPRCLRTAHVPSIRKLLSIQSIHLNKEKNNE